MNGLLNKMDTNIKKNWENDMKVYGLSITTLCPHKLWPIVKENTVVMKNRNNKVNKIYLKIIAGHSHCLASHYHWT